jgi:hypothetical protein
MNPINSKKCVSYRNSSSYLKFNFRFPLKKFFSYAYIAEQSVHFRRLLEFLIQLHDELTVKRISKTQSGNTILRRTLCLIGVRLQRETLEAPHSSTVKERKGTLAEDSVLLLE